MLSLLAESFLKNVSHNLKGFKKVNNKYNFRCPFCGDSAKNARKQRGWILDYKGKDIYKCFNCGLTMSFTKFLKTIDNDAYKRYLIEKNIKKDIEKSAVYEPKEDTNISYNDFISNQYIASCDKLNPGQIYLKSRKNQNLSLFYYTEDYGSLLKSLNLKKYVSEWSQHEPRLVIPHWDRNKELTFLQFRNLDKKSNLRYRTYRIKEESPKIWGLDRVDWNKKVFICEGAIDASFLENGIAMSGADVDISHSFISNYKDNLYFILDNEPYNKEICKRYRKLCELGYNVFIWNDIVEKDINDYYLAHNNKDVFEDISNYKCGLRLKLALANWLKN